METKRTMRINILGTEYEIIKKRYDEDDTFKRFSVAGYCSSSEQSIVLCDMTTYPGWDDEPEAACANLAKETLRHEIVHAFLNESGLAESSNECSAWARNEEMVDWFSLQGPKIYRAWKEVDAV